MLTRLWNRLRRAGDDESVPLADAPTFARPAARARRVRLLLAAVLIAGAVAAVAFAPTSPGRKFLPSSTAGIVALDVSSSIQPDTYYRIDHVLATLAESRQRLGLVLFSDVGYEALPTGTPAVQLRPLLRFFSPNGSPGTTPEGPWEQWFSAGTVISSGLYLSDQMLQENHVKHGSILLISDLSDDPTDYVQLSNAIRLLQLQKIPVEIIALNPSQQNAEFFKTLLPAGALIQKASLPTSAEASGKLGLVAGFPRGLAIAAVVVILLLTFNEWWAEPFRWRTRRVS